MNTALVPKKPLPSAVPVVLVGCLVLVAACAWGERTATVTATAQGALTARPIPALETVPAAVPAGHNPTELLRVGLERCLREVRDYSCVFFKQERLARKLTAQQVVRVLYRDEPRSVHMTWIRNPDRVRRALYVKGQRVGRNGEELAVVEPAGPLARLLVARLKVPIRGTEARKASRLAIDDFGFRATLERLIRDNERFAKHGALEWRYEGQAVVDGRPTYVLARHLPYAGPTGAYPDARLVVHLDQEWFLPVAVYSYADHQEQVLLGSYVTTRVKLNEGLDHKAFQF